MEERKKQRKNTKTKTKKKKLVLPSLPAEELFARVHVQKDGGISHGVFRRAEKDRELR